MNTSVAESSSESEDDAVEEYQGIDCPLHPSEETEEVTSPESSMVSVKSNNIRRSTRKGRGCNMRQLLEAERTPIKNPNPQLFSSVNMKPMDSSLHHIESSSIYRLHA